ncbi:MAG: hypothetical protein ACFFCW_50060, partial [Candidatus Hodarchaeota archaeon]
EAFEFTEFLWFVYNVTISLLFLLRVRPSVVSIDPIHWTVALNSRYCSRCRRWCILFLCISRMPRRVMAESNGSNLHKPFHT